MKKLNGCPRCNGAVLEIDSSNTDGPLCITCGWRRPEVPAEVRLQVEEHIGKPYLEDRYSHSRIATGKPPLSGWDRVKRRRERERRTDDGDGEVLVQEDDRGRRVEEPRAEALYEAT